MIRCSINLNKVALVRNARDRGGEPNLLEMARICLQNGADGITLHPRPDCRHALAEDALQLKELLQGGTAELNLEGNPFSAAADSYPGFMALVHQAKPHQCTLVPDAPDQLTSDRGWPLEEGRSALNEVIAELQSIGCRISLFIDPQPRFAERAAALGADCVEIFTGPWANAWMQLLRATDESVQQRLEQVHRQYQKTAQAAVDAGLGVHAGHDLNRQNLVAIARLPGLREVSIGQALVADALQLGMGAAVEQYVQILRRANRAGELPLDLPI